MAGDNSAARTFNPVSVAIITFLFTGCIALMIALAGTSKTNSYDRDQSFIKSSIATNAQNIRDLTAAVSQLTVQQAQLQEQIAALVQARKG